MAAALLISGCGLLSSDDNEADSTTTTAAGDALTDAAEGDSDAGTGSGAVVATTSSTTTTAAGGPAADDAEPTSNVTLESRLSTAGVGPIQIGHALDDARSAAGSLLIAVPGGSDACRSFTIQNAPEGIRLVAVDNEIVRVDIDSGPITTISGYGIGSSRSEILEAFGNRIEDGPGNLAIQYVPVDEPDADKRVIWETDTDGNVISLRSGRLPHVTPRVPCTG